MTIFIKLSNPCWVLLSRLQVKTLLFNGLSCCFSYFMSCKSQTFILYICICWITTKVNTLLKYYYWMGYFFDFSIFLFLLIAQCNCWMINIHLEIYVGTKNLNSLTMLHHYDNINDDIKSREMRVRCDSMICRFVPSS